MMSDIYLVFAPPDKLAKKPCREWNAVEAKEYRDWLLSVQASRVENLLKTLDEPCNGTPAAHLTAVGKKVAMRLARDSFSEAGPHGRRLTDLGYALAADTGLLIAQYLLDAKPGVLKWEIVRKPKSDMSYNLPVLVGFSFNYLDPVGGSIGEATAVLNNQRGPDVWRKTYEFWLQRASEVNQTVS